jgi:geranylgeranyl diphosphate synthase type I
LTLDEILERHRPTIERTLRESFAGRALGFYAPMRYHLGWEEADGRPSQRGSGKGLRPALCLLACEAAGGDPARALPAAAALELLHNFSLIHDDIQDGDRERRGRATVWTIWGVPQGINTGDGMIALSYLSLLRAGHSSPPAVVGRVAQTFAAAQLKICEGQYLDISFEDRLDVTSTDYLEMIGLKTAALLSGAAEIGALLAGAEHVAAFRAYGQNLGLAFQITDDVLGIWGDPTVTGKPAANDIRRRKKSFPVVYALEQSHAAGDGRMAAIYAAPDMEEAAVAEVLAILEERRARSHAHAIAERFHHAALTELAPLPQNEGKRLLIELSTALVEREY